MFASAMRKGALVAAMSCIACTGSLDEGSARPSGAPRPGPGCRDDRLAIGSAPMRRLSNGEYLNSLGEIFPGLRAPTLPALPPDTEVSGFENDARSLGATDVRVARWEEIAFLYAQEATRPGYFGTLLPCSTTATDEPSQRVCGEEFVRDFGLRTHRRPLTGEEEERYRTFLLDQRTAIDFPAAVQLTAMAMLQSPWFLYRLELPDEARASGGVVALTSWEIASRLSFFLWERTPDATLLQAAAMDELRSADAIATHARRMLDDPRARAAVGDFHRQWLHLDRILEDEHMMRVPELYPDWTAQTPRAVEEETRRFIVAEIFDGEGTLASLFLSRRAFVNRSMAQIYGVPGPASDTEWSEVMLPEGERAGLLTRAAFLASHAHRAAGSPPLRGVFITENLLCEPRPSPPASADTSPPQQMPGEPARTNRQLFEARTAPALCQSCHVRIDGFGYGFEHYDAVGAFRDVDGASPVDASGALVGTDVDGEYDGALELSERLAGSSRVTTCTIQRYYRYALGRTLERDDDCVVARLRNRFLASGGDIQSLLVDIVTSAEFRHRPLAQE